MVKDFYIRNMVCDRCIKVLKNEIEAQGLVLKEVVLGRVQLDIQDDSELEKLKNIIESNGFELIATAEDKLTEQVKIHLIKILGDLPIGLQGEFV